MRSVYRPRWPLLLALAAGVAAVFGLTYVTSEPTGEQLPAHGGSYVEGVAGAPTGINPLFTINDVEEDLASLVFSGLVRLGPRGDVQPDLAEKWTVSPDGLEYTFQLRENVFWHDAQILDADDVLFTIRAIQDPDFQGDPRLAAVFQGVTMEAPNRSTVIMTLPRLFAPFPAFADVGILPEHLLADLDASGLADAPFNDRPIGNGPFRLTELTSSRAVLESFDAYHLDGPLLETLELRFYRDEGTLLNALREGDIDGALFQSGLTADDVKLLDDDSRWVRRSLHTTTYSLVYLNLQTPAFEDAKVRRALQHSLDQDALIQETLEGQALPIDSPITLDLWAYVSFPDAYTFNQGRAATLLNEAGWILGEAGREKDRIPLQFTLSTVDDPVQIQVAEALARQWGQLGIQVTIRVSGASDFRDELLLRRDFEAALGTIRPAGPDPDPYPFWHSTQAFGEGLNVTGFSNEEADQLLESARQTPPPAERAEAYSLFQQIFAQELPAVLLSTPAYQYIHLADLKGVSPGLLFTPSARFYDVQRWFVETKESTDDER